MRFVEPLYLLLLLLLPLLFWLRYRRGEVAIGYPSVGGLKGRGTFSVKARKVVKAFSLLAMALIVVALARPQISIEAEEVPVEGIDIVLAIDVSGSMKTGDKLQKVKEIAKEFVRGRESDRIGIVAFAGKAFMVVPPTTDYRALEWHIDRLAFGMVSDGTAIGMALTTSTNLLRRTDGRGRIVILLSDGVNNSGRVGPLTAASLARALGIRVYAIEEGNRFEHYLNSFQGNWAMADTNLLKEVSTLTGGRYFNISGMDRLLGVYREIERIEKKTIRERRYRYRELSPWLISAALFLLTAEMVLLNTAMRKIP